MQLMTWLERMRRDFFSKISNTPILLTGVVDDVRFVQLIYSVHKFLDLID